MGIQPGSSTLPTRLLPETARFHEDVLHIAEYTVHGLLQKFGTPHAATYAGG